MSDKPSARRPAGGGWFPALILLILLSGLGTRSGAQPPSRQPVPGLSFRYAETPRDSGRQSLIVRVEIAPGWHINSDAPLDEFLVPTRVEIEAEGAEWGRPRFPPPERVHSDAAGGDMLLFSGTFEIEVPARRKPAKAAPKEVPKAKGGPEARTKVTLHYQACDHATCYPPKAVTVER